MRWRLAAGRLHGPGPVGVTSGGACVEERAGEAEDKPQTVGQEAPEVIEAGMLELTNNNRSTPHVWHETLWADRLRFSTVRWKKYGRYRPKWIGTGGGNRTHG